MRTLPRRPRSYLPRRYLSTYRKTQRIVSRGTMLYCGVFLLSTLFIQFVRTDSIHTDHAIAVLIDSSLSMSSADIPPNRYNHALSLMTGLLDAYPAQYTLLPFGAYPMIRIPLSHDLDGVKHIVTATTLGSYQLGDVFMGSSPGSALGLGYLSLKSSDTSHKTIVLLSDGSANTGYARDTFLPQLQAAHIPVIACAIGESEYTLGESYNNTPIMSARDTGFLENITTMTSGALFLCNDRTTSIQELATALKQRGLPRDITYSIARERWREKPRIRALFIISLAYHLIITINSYIVYSRKKMK